MDPSDGSCCSHAWVLNSLLPDGPSISDHAIDEFQDSTTARIEGLGHLAYLYIYRALVKWFQLVSADITTNTIRAYINNKAVISHLSHPNFRSLKQALQADLDITNETLHVLKSLPTTINHQHVKSHKYDNPGPTGPTTFIPYHNCLNKLCDEDCTAAYLCPPCLPTPSTLSFPSTTCFLIVGGRRFPGRSRDYLRKRMMEYDTRDYLMETEDLSATVFDNISWTHLEKALRCRLGGNRRSAHKLQFRLLPTLCHRFTRGGERSLDRRCPHCTTFHHGDFEHIFHCTAPAAVTQRLSALHSFSTALTTNVVATFPAQLPLKDKSAGLQDP